MVKYWPILYSEIDPAQSEWIETVCQDWEENWVQIPCYYISVSLFRNTVLLYLSLQCFAGFIRLPVRTTLFNFTYLLIHSSPSFLLFAKETPHQTMMLPSLCWRCILDDVVYTHGSVIKPHSSAFLLSLFRVFLTLVVGPQYILHDGSKSALSYVTASDIVLWPNY